MTPRDHAQAPADPELAELLGRTRTVAVVGMSPRAERTSYGVADWMLRHSPYEMYWVNPVAVGQEALGRPFYASLADLPVVPDMVDVFRRSEDVPPVAEEAIAVGAKSLWLQLGIVNDEAAAAACDAGLEVVQNRCLKVEYRRLAH